MSRPAKTAPSAPPWVSTDDPRAERVRALLHQSFSMSVVRAAAASPKVRPVADVEPPAKEALEAAPKATPAPASAGAPPSNGFSSATERPSPAMPDPISKTVKMVAAGFGVLILLILMTSHNNSKKYYIQPIDNAIEIRKGLFSPKDNDFFMVLHGTQLTGSVKDVYSKEEVYPLIFNYYLEKADTLLEVPGLPDFEGIKIYLKEARKFAISKKMHQTVAIRLNTIERMILLYRADVAISKGTVQSLDNAIKYLNGAQKFTTTPAHGQEIQQKLNLATSLKAALETKANRKGK